MKFGILLATVLLAASSAPVASAADAGTTLPRYALVVGKELNYSVSIGQSGADAAAATTQKWHYIVSSKNSDSSYHMIFRIDQHTPANGDQAATDEVSFLAADVSPNGRMQHVDGLNGTRLPISLPQLPRDAAELTAGWTSRPTETLAENMSSTSDPSHNPWTFQGTAAGVFNRIYGLKESSKYTFDTANGRITSIVSSMSGATSDDSAKMKVAFDSETMIPAAELRAMNADAGAMFASEKNFQAKMAEMNDSISDIDALAKDLRKSLGDTAAKITDPAMKQQVKELADAVDQVAKDASTSRKALSAIVDHPAPQMTATDLSGKTHHLSEYKGKVVVMDFWYRGCGWCMLETPGLIELSNDLKGKDAVVLGINTDQDIDDAKFVVSALKVSYPTWRIDDDTTAAFHVEAFPTVIVLDKNGVIRAFHSGYSPTAREELARKIEALLRG